MRINIEVDIPEDRFNGLLGPEDFLAHTLTAYALFKDSLESNFNQVHTYIEVGQKVPTTLEQEFLRRTL